MTILNILKEPDPILRKKSSEVETINQETKKLMDNMLETMYQAPGIGLAAPQVGVLKKIIVIDSGKIIEEGNHTTLLERKGVYFDLYKQQLESDK